MTEPFCDRCGFCHPDHEDWRAILARDVADVERWLPKMKEAAIRRQVTAALQSDAARDGLDEPTWEDVTVCIAQECAFFEYDGARRLAEEHRGAEAWLTRARAALS